VENPTKTSNPQVPGESFRFEIPAGVDPNRMNRLLDEMEAAEFRAKDARL
jgi:hypothetical protein